MSEALDILEQMLIPQNAVSFKEFVSGVDYCNNPDLYQRWYEEEEKIPAHCRELLLGGSLGSGKSTFGAYYVCYRVYLLFVNGSPQQYLGLPVNADLYCFYFSTSMETAKQSGYNLIYSIFKECKWFKENAPINTELKSTVDFIDKHFYFKAASDFGHQLSLNVPIFILDEANFRGGVGTGVESDYLEVQQLYEQLLDRQISRFARPDGSVDALAVLISSASYQSSFFDKRKAAIKGRDDCHCISLAAYETKPERFSKETFEVFIGAGVVEPEIIESEDQKKKLLKSANLLGTGQEEEFFKKVPMNLLSSFKSHIVLALQNHCGVSTPLQGSFMSNMKYLYDSYVDDEVIPPAFQNETLSASTEDTTAIIEYLIEDNIQYPERPHSVFLDLSVRGDTGSLVCFRYDGEDDGRDIHTKVFELKIVPPPFPYATDITKVQDFIITFAAIVNLVAFGSDQYQSTQLRQNVTKELGLDDIRVSIDSSDIPHNIWTQALSRGCIRQKKSSLLEKEVEEAVHDYVKHRVLKAKGSTDDTLQGNVGAYFLSETVGAHCGTLDDLYPEGNINLVGGQSISSFLRDMGFKGTI